ncbi:unnamed protein product [Paramecium pentaurelia]|uniref:Kelch motif family protein n=1 Tax=Paramecium pentaurelia TaxID=43138 RepID=A0A8S1UBT2_9CILI|nr:unnamed protein product [Paramecium pentaurelia]
MNNQNNSSFNDASFLSEDLSLDEKQISFHSNYDSDLIFTQKKQKIELNLESQQEEDQKQLLIEQLNLILTPHRCPKIAQVDKDLEQLNVQINNLKIFDSTTYQKSIQKIKSIKKVISQVIDKYFINLIQQYQVITDDLLQISLQPLKRLIFNLRNELHNYDESQLQEVFNRQNIINEEFNLIKNNLPKDITLQINNKSLYDIKDSLQKLISLKFKDEFKIIPNYFSGFKQQKKNLVTLKNKANKFKLQEIQNTIYSFRNNILYSSNIDEIDKVLEQQLILSQNQSKLDYVTIINTNQYLYFIGQVFQDSETSSKIITDLFNKYDKVNNKLQKLQDLPYKSYGGQALKYGKSIYYWGGYVQLENLQLGSKKGFIYSIEYDKWEQIESMKYPRIQGQCCLLDHKIYLIGGMMNQYVANGLIEIYDSILMKFVESFELINQLSYVPQLLGYALPISNQEILVMGGQNQFGNECGSQLINILLKTIFKQQIYLFNSEEKKIEFIQINADTLQVKNIIQIQ